MSIKRIQLTLFLNKKESIQIEKIRQEFNPKQFQLIKSHITLCREDELERLPEILHNLRTQKLGSLMLQIDKPIRFSEGKGVFLSIIDSLGAFQTLRKHILYPIIEKPRKHDPHITLMHPRNSTCTDHIFERIERRNFPVKVTFNKVSLIEQEIGKEWKILEEFALGQTD